MLALRVTPYILDDRFPTFLPLSRIQLLGYNPKELYSLYGTRMVMAVERRNILRLVRFGIPMHNKGPKVPL